MFRCVARYGYKDIRKEDHRVFEQLLVESLEKFLRRESQEIALEASTIEPDVVTEPDETSVRFSDSQSVETTDELHVPLLFRHTTGGIEDLPASAFPEEEPGLEYELSALQEATASGFTYLLAHGEVRARKESFFTKKLMVNYFYGFLRRNCRAGTANLRVPHMNIIRVGMTYMV